MLRTNKFLSLAASSLLLVGMAVVANADTQIIGPQTVTTTTDFSGNFLFAKFDPSLGTLNSVFLTLGTDFTTTLTVTNTGGGSSTGTANTKVQAVLYDPTTVITTPSNLITPVGGVFNLKDSLASDDVGFTLASGTSTVLNPPEATKTKSSAPSFTSPSVLTYFTGATGSAQINYLTLTATSVSFTGGNTNATQVTTDTLSATVQYNFTPAGPSGVPEPGTWAMLVAGASTGLVALRRRRNKK